MAEELYGVSHRIMNLDVRGYVCCFSGKPVYDEESGDIRKAIDLMLSSAIPAYLTFKTIPGIEDVPALARFRTDDSYTPNYGSEYTWEEASDEIKEDNRTA
jgi:hypothetical protein